MADPKPPRCLCMPRPSEVPVHADDCPYEETNRLDQSAVQNWCFARKWCKANRGVEGDAQAREVILAIAEACRG